MKNILKQTIFFSLCLLGGVTYGQTGYLYHNNIDGFQSMIFGMTIFSPMHPIVPII